MLISTLAATPPARPAAAAPSTPPGHPAVEWWTVGARRFDTTDQLVSGVQPPPEGAVATYHYFENSGDNDPAKLQANVLKSTLGGAAIGAVVGGVLGGVATVGFSVGLTILSAGFIQVAPTLALAGLCAGAGAFLGGGASRAEAKDYAVNGHTIDGTVLTNNGHMMFYQGDSIQNGVDLNTYAQGGQPWWKGSQP